MARLLIDHGAVVEEASVSSWTPLFAASSVILSFSFAFFVYDYRFFFLVCCVFPWFFFKNSSFFVFFLER